MSHVSINAKVEDSISIQGKLSAGVELYGHAGRVGMEPITFSDGMVYKATTGSLIEFFSVKEEGDLHWTKAGEIENTAEGHLFQSLVVVEDGIVVYNRENSATTTNDLIEKYDFNGNLIERKGIHSIFSNSASLASAFHRGIINTPNGGVGCLVRNSSNETRHFILNKDLDLIFVPDGFANVTQNVSDFVIDPDNYCIIATGTALYCSAISPTGVRLWHIRIDHTDLTSTIMLAQLVDYSRNNSNRVYISYKPTIGTGILALVNKQTGEIYNSISYHASLRTSLDDKILTALFTSMTKYEDVNDVITELQTLSATGTSDGRIRYILDDYYIKGQGAVVRDRNGVMKLASGNLPGVGTAVAYSSRFQSWGYRQNPNPTDPLTGFTPFIDAFSTAFVRSGGSSIQFYDVSISQRPDNNIVGLYISNGAIIVYDEDFNEVQIATGTLSVYLQAQNGKLYKWMPFSNNASFYWFENILYVDIPGLTTQITHSDLIEDQASLNNVKIWYKINSN